MLLDLVIEGPLPTNNCCIIIMSCSCHHATLQLSIIQKPLSFGSYLICIANCICLLICCQMPKLSWGHIFYLSPPPFLSPLYNSTTPLTMTLQLFFLFVFGLAHEG